MAHQIPFKPQIIGNTRTENIWNTSVRKNEIAADTPPLFKAVKNEDVKILIPDKTKEKENIWNAYFVISKSSMSYPTNMLDNGAASALAVTIIRNPVTPISTMLF